MYGISPNFDILLDRSYKSNSDSLFAIIRSCKYGRKQKSSCQDMHIEKWTPSSVENYKLNIFSRREDGETHFELNECRNVMRLWNRE